MFRPPPPRPQQPAASSSTLPSDQGTSDASGPPTTGLATDVEHTSGGATPTPPRSMIAGIFEDNPYFSAGAGLMGIGVALTVLRRAATLSATLAQRRLLVTLEIPSKDRSYPWFLEWMAQQTPAPSPDGRSSRSLMNLLKGKGAVQVQSHQLAVETTYKQHENGSSEALFSLVPGPGTHYFRYKGAWMQVKRERDSKLMDLHSGIPWETVTLTTLSRDRHLFPLLLAEARALADQGTEGKTVIYTAWGAEWRPFGKPRRKREVQSVVLKEGVAERVEDDLRRFLSRGKWYAERGIPYRRGYLLHGPPGSGKTSFIQSLAGALSYNICLLNLSERGLTDDKLNHLLGLAPERSIILLEDIDAAFNKRVQTSEDGYKSSVTFSGLLNALDGVASAEERIIFMTTNHYSSLDSALVRPGRVDLSELLDDAEGEQAERLFVRFYGDGKYALHQAGGGIEQEALSEERIRHLGNALRKVVEQEKAAGKRVSMASLQGWFIRHGPEEDLERIRELFGTRE